MWRIWLKGSPALAHHIVLANTHWIETNHQVEAATCISAYSDLRDILM
jgi:hypothetical protein